jgi:hypothetical protein
MKATRGGFDRAPIDLLAQDDATGAGGAFKQKKWHAAAVELVRRCKPCNAAADNDDVVHVAETTTAKRACSQSRDARSWPEAPLRRS